MNNLAHRGMSGIAPENTKFAFESAHRFGFDGVEIDVHLTKDKELVIIHDEKINRTSNGRGYVKSKTLKELKEYNFSPKYDGIEKSEILTLKEFLNDFGDKFKIINIELKTDVFDYPGIEQKVLKEMMNYKKTEFILSSFNFETIERLRELDSNVKIGFLWSKHKKFLEVDKAKIEKVCNYLHPSIRLFKNPVFAHKYKAFEKPFVLWTIKSRVTYKRLSSRKNIHAMISNHLFKNNLIIKRAKKFV